MVMNNPFLLSLIFLCLCGCTNKETRVVEGEFIAVTDSKPCSDSLYAVWSEHGNFTNPRYLELPYLIHNYTEEKMYLPIKNRSDSMVDSSIDVYFLNKTDTIRPIYYIKKIPYNSSYINRGDSLILFIDIINFEEWSEKEINVSTNLDTLIDRLHLEYHKSQKDVKEGFVIPDIRFDNLPRFYYEIPRGGNIWVM